MVESPCLANMVALRFDRACRFDPLIFRFSQASKPRQLSRILDPTTVSFPTKKQKGMSFVRSFEQKQTLDLSLALHSAANS